ncbi:beta-ketoacyl synthase N-terminal-like domain-containing protein [Streptomyces sp. NPDC048191]|uniref:type I polyketide synthase n=1 Tax=Streptomyces sp. NPDC048191 TaxID=3155484 RepID=UPI0033E44DD7
MKRAQHPGEIVAVVGMGCRFPQANGVDEYWNLSFRNIDAITRVPADRFDPAEYHCSEVATPGKSVSRDGGFLDDLFAFDAAFFGISPVEARKTDPQQRVLLEVVWEALEAANIRPSDLAGSRTGVFMGQATAEYAETTQPVREPDVGSVAGSRIRAITSGRVSYALDLRGPSVLIDTACSSSLVAVHTARQSLLTGECDLALAGGVNAVLSPYDFVAYSQGGMLSPRGRCRFGDASADGYVRSEGAGVVVLKRLSDAVRDGDGVLGLLLGSAVTNDGRSSGLLLQPSVDGQVEMVRAACRSAGITPGQLDYVEAHGTGTGIGDAVELRALAEAVGAERSPRNPLRTGSVKTNMGHTEAAAGIAGLIRALLIARHGKIPASLHLENPNSVLRDGSFPVTVVDANEPLRKAGPQALIGVSSFGISGTNAHVVVGEFVPEPEAVRQPADHSADDGGHLLVITARSPESLRRLAHSYADHLSPGGRGREHPLRDLCATAALHRDAHPHRLWVTGTTHDELAARLRALADGQPVVGGGVREAGFGTGRRTAFVFPGQGSQWLGMGRVLLRTSEAFRAALHACDKAVESELGWSVEELLTGPAQEFPAGVENVQPALWAMQVAIAAAWRERGVDPDICVGHSMGEVAAAQVSGALSLEDAAAVVCRRSRLMSRTAGEGGMLLVELSAQGARDVVEAHGLEACVAAENAPTSTVLAGDLTALATVARDLETRGVLCRLVRVDVASHSPHMDPLRPELLAELDGLAPVPATTDMVSTVTGAPVRGPELDARYWMDNLRMPVRFTHTVRDVAAAAETVFVEISPHPLLVGAVEETLANAGLEGAAVASLRREVDERAELLCSVGRFFAAGGRVDWRRWYGTGYRPAPLPSYAWHQFEFRQEASTEPLAAPAAHVHRVAVDDWGAEEWGAGVRLLGRAPLPPAACLSAILEAAHQAAPSAVFAVEDLRLGEQTVDLARERDVVLRVSVDRSRRPWRVTVDAELPGGGERPACAGATLRDVGATEGLDAKRTLDAVLGRCNRYLSAGDFRDLARDLGIELDEAFTAVEQLWSSDSEVVARMRRTKAPRALAWETALQPLLLASQEAAARAGGPRLAYAPVEFASAGFLSEPTDDFWTVVRFEAHDGAGEVLADALVLDRDGRVLADFRGIRLRRLGDDGEDGATARSEPLGMPYAPGGTGPRSAALAPLVNLAPLAGLGAPLVNLGREGARSLLSRAAGLIDRAVSLAPYVRLDIGQRQDPGADVGAPPRGAGAPDATGGAPGARPPAEPFHLEPLRTEPVRTERPPAEPARAEPRGGQPLPAQEELARRAAEILGLPATGLDPRRPLRDYGLDSLMAVRLQQRLRAETGMEVTAGRLLSAESLGSIMGSLPGGAVPA